MDEKTEQRHEEPQGVTFEGFPLILSWELTLACNLRCRHCASSCEHARPDELSTDECLALCEQFPALLVSEVDFTGGEPLLRKDWSIIAARLKELKIPTQIISNGLSFTDTNIRLMQETGICAVGVSIDGLEDVHDYVRGRQGVFREVTSAIPRVQEAGIPVTVITTMNARNVDQLPTLLRVLSELKVPRWQVQPMFPLGRARAADDLELTEAVYWKMAAFVKEYTPRAEAMGVDMTGADSFGYFTEWDTRDEIWRGCPAGRVTCGITCDGKVKPCLSLPDSYIEGDLRKRDFWSIWFDPKSFVANRQFTTRHLGEHCVGCEHGEMCMGGCMAMSVGATGQAHNNPFCFHGLSCLAGQHRAVSGIRW